MKIFDAFTYKMLNIAMGLGCAIIYMVKLPDLFEEGAFIIIMIGLLAMMFLSTTLQTVIHELGHLVFGRMSGYQFLSFRIGNHVWIQEDGVIKHKRYTLVGTGGQCLLVPPDVHPSQLPYKLYLSGGCVMNVISCVLFVVLSLLVRNAYVDTALLIMGYMGFIFALLNGLPFHLENVDNDACTMESIGESEQAKYGYWLQMKVHAEIASGKALRELPEEWFVDVSMEDMQNSMGATIYYLTMCRLMNQHRFDEVLQKMNQELLNSIALAGVHRHMLLCDLMYCKVLRGESIEELLSDKQKQFMQAMRNNISVLRTEYVIALANGRTQDAQRWQQVFESVASQHPYAVEAVDERELMEYANNTLQQEVNEE